LDNLGRVADSVGVDSKFWFRLEWVDDGMKHFQKMKWRHRACLSSLRKKRDTAWCCSDVGQRRGKREETTLVWLTQILLGQI
jgi:hypothetical protein